MDDRFWIGFRSILEAKLASKTNQKSIPKGIKFWIGFGIDFWSIWIPTWNHLGPLLEWIWESIATILIFVLDSVFGANFWTHLGGLAGVTGGTAVLWRRSGWGRGAPSGTEDSPLGGLLFGRYFPRQRPVNGLARRIIEQASLRTAALLHWRVLWPLVELWPKSEEKFRQDS